MKKLYLLLSCMSRNVYVHKAVVYNIRALFQKFVYNAVYVLFVAGDRRCAYYHLVAGAYLDLAVVARCNAGKCRHRFALAARGYYNKLFVAVFV